MIDPFKEETIPGFEPFTDGMVIDRNKISSEFINFYIDAEEKYVGGIFINFTGVDENGDDIKIIIESGRKKTKNRERYYPYFVMGNCRNLGNKPSLWKPVPGYYTLHMTPYGQKKKLNTLGQPMIIRFTVK